MESWASAVRSRQTLTRHSAVCARTARPWAATPQSAAQQIKRRVQADGWRFIVISGIMRLMNILRISSATALLIAVSSGAVSAQTDKQGTTYRSPNGSTLKLMLDDSNVGPEVTVGELTFPPNTDSGDHAHGAIEMFYVLSGELEHIVNGKSQILGPGMTGYVRPPDKIRHKTGPAGAKVIVIWVPGDEARK